MTNSEPLDLTGLVAAIITFFASKEVAEIASPYIAIIIASVMAAGWALSKTGEMNVYSTFRFILLRVGTAIIFSVTVAELIHLAAAWAQPRYTMVPIAFLIALVRDFDELKEYKDGLLNWFKSRGNNV